MSRADHIGRPGAAAGAQDVLAANRWGDQSQRITGGDRRSNTKDHQGHGVSVVSQHKGATDYNGELAIPSKDYKGTKVIQGLWDKGHHVYKLASQSLVEGAWELPQ